MKICGCCGHHLHQQQHRRNNRQRILRCMNQCKTTYIVTSLIGMIFISTTFLYWTSISILFITITTYQQQQKEQTSLVFPEYNDVNDKYHNADNNNNFNYNNTYDYDTDDKEDIHIVFSTGCTAFQDCTYTTFVVYSSTHNPYSFLVSVRTHDQCYSFGLVLICLYRASICILLSNI
jgi:hypothetical protein